MEGIRGTEALGEFKQMTKHCAPPLEWLPVSYEQENYSNLSVAEFYREGEIMSKINYEIDEDGDVEAYVTKVEELLGGAVRYSKAKFVLILK